jgi:hypothetical protein
MKIVLSGTLIALLLLIAMKPEKTNGISAENKKSKNKFKSNTQPQFVTRLSGYYSEMSVLHPDKKTGMFSRVMDKFNDLFSTKETNYELQSA